MILDIRDPKSIPSLIIQLEERVEEIEFGYEMNCLISREFTPAPDYSGVFRLIDQSGWQQEEVIDYLSQLPIPECYQYSSIVQLLYLHLKSE